MSDHQAPKEGNECNICMEPIDSTNYVEYRLKNETSWHPSQLCSDCVQYLLDSSMDNYLSRFFEEDCKKSKIGYLKKKPPTYLHLRELSLENDSSENEEIEEVWYMADQSVHSGKVKNAFSEELTQNFISYYGSLLLLDPEVSEEDKNELPGLKPISDEELSVLEEAIKKAREM